MKRYHKGITRIAVRRDKRDRPLGKITGIGC